MPLALKSRAICLAASAMRLAMPVRYNHIVNNKLWGYNGDRLEDMLIRVIRHDLFQRSPAEQEATNHRIWSGAAGAEWNARQGTPGKHAGDVEALKALLAPLLATNRYDAVGELGCGAGYVIAGLSDISDSTAFHGVDINADTIAEARASNRVAFHHADFTEFLHTFPAVCPVFVFRQVLMFLPDPRPLIDTLRRRFPNSPVLLVEMIYQPTSSSVSHFNGRYSHNFPAVFSGYRVAHDELLQAKAGDGKRLYEMMPE